MTMADDGVFEQVDFRVRFGWGPHDTARLAPLSHLVVVVDVLRFTTAVTVAVERGAIVYPYRWRDDRALELAARVGAVLAASNDPTGPSLSPVSLRGLGAGERLVLPSPNGATLSLAAAEHGAEVVAASLRNASAVGAEPARRGRRRERDRGRRTLARRRLAAVLRRPGGRRRRPVPASDQRSLTRSACRGRRVRSGTGEPWRSARGVRLRPRAHREGLRRPMSRWRPSSTARPCVPSCATGPTLQSERRPACARATRTPRAPALRCGDRRSGRSAGRSSRTRTRDRRRDRRTRAIRPRRRGRTRSARFAAPNDLPSMKPSPKQLSVISTSSVPHACSAVAAATVDCRERAHAVDLADARRVHAAPANGRRRCRSTTAARPRAAPACSTSRCTRTGRPDS